MIQRDQNKIEKSEFGEEQITEVTGKDSTQRGDLDEY